MMAVEAKVTWQEGMRFEGTASSGHTVILDSSAEHGGQNAGFRPMELLLVGMAGCTAMDVISILRKKRQKVTGFEVRVRGERAEEHPRIYTDIHVEYVVRGEDISPAAVERAIQLSEEKYCSASAMLGKAARITSSYRIEPA
ncbi:MAG TPA: OsmC family protein [Caldilineae bacterium]|nr:OsmC family protein [Caldilineae bacterium]